MLRDVAAFLSGNGLEFVSAGEQFQVKVCPFCGDEKGHFYIHREKGLWDCKKCGNSGNLYTLAQHLQVAEKIVSAETLLDSEYKEVLSFEKIESYRRALLEDQNTLEYLRKRGFNSLTLEHFKLGLKRENGEKWLVIPHLLNEACVNVKYRSLPPAEKTFRRLKGGKSVLFNIDSLDSEQDLFITEGETDAMTLWQHGWENTLGNTLGAGSFKGEWMDSLDNMEKIFIIYDSDEAGQEGALKLAKRLGLDRCWNVVLPVKDVNDYFREHTNQDFKRLLRKAKRFEIEGILSVNDVFNHYLQNLRAGETKNSVEWGWERIEQLSGGLVDGGLTILTARPKVGKTSLALNVALHNSMLNTPILFYCLEMSSEQLLPRLVAVVRNKGIHTLTETDFIMTQAKLLDKPFYFGGNSRTLEIGIIRDTLEQAILRYGTKLVVFDHLHYLIRGSANPTQETGYVVREFKRMAMEMGVHILLIAQTRKIPEGHFIDIYDLRDSGALAYDADLIVALHRRSLLGESADDAEGVLEPETVVRIVARAGTGGQTRLDFNSETFRFTEAYA